MATEDFLRSVLCDTGVYCLFAVRASEKKPRQTFHATIPELLAAADERAHEGFDTFFALATFKHNGTRTAENVDSLRALFVDLDCGQGKGYATQQDALRGLRAFCVAKALPKPHTINSGRGIHAYWPLTTPLPREEWAPLAEGFKALCLSSGLAIDPVVTADCARVLRVPGTRNFKADPPLPVRVLFASDKRLDPTELKAKLPAVKPRAVPKTLDVDFGSDPLMDTLIGNTTSRFKTILTKSAAGKGCAQLLHAATKQADTDEPTWRAALSIAVHCVDADKAIHAVSKKHPDYSPEDTVAKAQLIKGPYLCASFEALHPGLCASCPHKGKLTSPIQLGKEVLEADEADNVVVAKRSQWADDATAGDEEFIVPKYPWPYFRGKTGGIYLKDKDDADEPIDICIYHSDIYVVGRVRDDHELGDAVLVRYHSQKDGVRERYIPTASISSREELRVELGKMSIVVNKIDPLMHYLIKWVDNMQYTSSAGLTCKQFGWTNDRFESFAMGPYLVYPDKVVPNAPSKTTAPLFDMFRPAGTLQGWKDTMEFYNRPGFEPYQYIVGTGFGSILTRMTPIRGSIFHFHSKDSGLGKTSAMFAAASIWAAPDRYVLNERDTIHSKMLRAETMKDFALYLDEMTNIKPSDASDMIYQIPSGAQRNRMAGNQNAERERGEPWALICVTTGNTSLLERVSEYKAVPKAEAQRVLEYQAPKIAFATKSETDAFAAALKQNYGHVGIEFVQYVMCNVQTINDLVAKTQRALDTAAGLQAENRYWSVQAACDLTGLLIAKKLGFIGYDLDALRTWTVGVLQQSKKDTNEADLDSVALISEYLVATYSNFLRLHSTVDLRKKDSPAIIDASPKGSLMGRHDIDINVWYVIPGPLREWCIRRQINYGWLVKSLTEGEAQASLIKTRLGKGTKIDLPPMTVLKLNGAGWMTDDIAEKLKDALAVEDD